MKPIPFKEMNKILVIPLGIPVHDIDDLPVFRDGEQVISCWKLGFWDRMNAVIFGKVWLGVLGKKSQPPVRLDCCRTIFQRENRVL